MSNIAALGFVILMVLSSGFKEEVWIIDPQSQLIIHGATNINNFTCRLDCYNGYDTLAYVRNERACELQFSRNRMSVPVRSFNCGAREISKDFWKTLKSDKHPFLDIRFRSLQDIAGRKDDCVNGVVDISIAGATARYTIRYRVTLKDKNTLLLKGTHSVQFSDFNLDAPQKLKGLIKVKEVLNVEFDLVLKTV